MGAASPLESTILDLWREVLDVPAIGRDDSFFTLGGDSLSAAILVARLRLLLAIDLQPSDLFRRPTVAQLSGHIEELRQAQAR